MKEAGRTPGTSRPSGKESAYPPAADSYPDLAIPAS
jgi:hypothetical protein